MQDVQLSLRLDSPYFHPAGGTALGVLGIVPVVQRRHGVATQTDHLGAITTGLQPCHKGGANPPTRANDHGQTRIGQRRAGVWHQASSMKRTLTLLPFTPPLLSFCCAWLAMARSTAT